MTDMSTNTSSATLGVQEGHTVRLIGGTPELEAALKPLPENVTVTTLASEPADIGIIVVDDEADLRERLFTELDGLTSATHLWIVAENNAEPTVEAIRAEAKVLGWHDTTTTTLGTRWVAVDLRKI